ncbi:unnamed protein product [Owenia fusiformis]|uniref:Uncharacterized protein n=1 Tax=Owenia fusiformis TaxID=6347 RepID=A0A8J1USD6_OWEFU|nr:unnamed protein product [Owenia fusiformis]
MKIYMCLMVLVCATIPNIVSAGTITALRRTLELYSAEVDVSTRAYSKVAGPCPSASGTCNGICCASDSGTACTAASPCCIEQGTYPGVYSRCIKQSKRELELIQDEMDVSTRAYSKVAGPCPSASGTCNGICCASDSGTACTAASPCCIEQGTYPGVYSRCIKQSKRELELIQDEMDVSTRAYSKVAGPCPSASGTCNGICCASDSGTACTAASPCCIEQGTYPGVYSRCIKQSKRELELIQDEMDVSTRAYSKVAGPCPSASGTCNGICCASDSGTACTAASPCCIEQGTYPGVYSRCIADNKREMYLRDMLNNLIKRISKENK